MSTTTRTRALDDARAGTAEGVAASAWIRSIVDGGRQPCRVVGAVGPACYVRVGTDAVIAVETIAGAGLPNAVTLDPSRRGLAGLVVGADGAVGDGTLRLDDRTFAVRRWWDPHPRVGWTGPEVLRRRRALLPAGLPAGHDAFGLGPPVDRLRAAALRRDHDAVRGVVGDLVGRGPGSTPAGDDVLAGLLATLRVFADGRDRVSARFTDVLARETRRVAHRTTALSATLLRCADDGAVVEAARRVLRALAGHDRLRPAVGTLAGVGHTSGRDLLTGIAIAVDLLTTREAVT